MRNGARVVKRYHAPQTPYARLLLSDEIAEQVKTRLQAVAETLDPLQLLSQLRHTQQQLALLADGGQRQARTHQQDDLTRFLASLSTAWHDGEVRPKHGTKPKPSRHWRTRKDPFDMVWPDDLRMAGLRSGSNGQSALSTPAL